MGKTTTYVVAKTSDAGEATRDPKATAFYAKPIASDGSQDANGDASEPTADVWRSWANGRSASIASTAYGRLATPRWPA